MKKILLIFLSFLLIFSQTQSFEGRVLADECDNPSGISDENVIKNCLNKVNGILEAISKANKTNKNALSQMEKDVAKLQGQINSLSLALTKKEKDLSLASANLNFQEDLLSQTIRSYYIKSQSKTPLLAVFASSDAKRLINELGYWQSIAKHDREIIINITNQINNLASEKKNLEKQQSQLASIKQRTNEEASFLRGEVQKATSYEGQLSQQIAGLSARQQQLLAEKTGSFMTSVGEVPEADDPASRPDYNPGFSPAFAAFSFGAPHRKGMSQYGAYGRAKSGQNYRDILRAYYGNASLEKRDLPGMISTTLGTKNFEDDYLMGIAEMPASWADNGGYEALKAQAVAARSYAMVAGKPICTTESCQVYSSSKAANPPDAWKRAVNETRGQVLVGNGQIISTWYASTAGGYTYGYVTNGFTTPGEWDTKCGNQGCWTSEAYEKIAGSPWFYKAWYKPRGVRGSRSHPWLNNDEFADIVNAILLYKKDNGTVSHLSQTDKANPDTWSREEVRQQLKSRGGTPIDGVSSVGVSYSTGGYTQTVSVNGISLDGGDFKQIFNMRAPGEINLQSALFNVVKK